MHATVYKSPHAWGVTEQDSLAVLSAGLDTAAQYVGFTELKKFNNVASSAKPHPMVL